MIEEVIQNIVDNANFKKKDEFHNFIKKCVFQFFRKEEADKESTRQFKSIIFKLDVFFKNFTPFQNEFGKDKIYVAGVEALYVIANELKIEVDKSDLFIVFHLRNLGKFRIKEEKLLTELKELWSKPFYKEYEIENKQDFAASIRALRDADVITYRHGNMTVNPSVILRYR